MTQRTPFTAHSSRDIKPGDRVRVTREFEVKEVRGGYIKGASGVNLSFEPIAEGDFREWLVLDRKCEEFVVGGYITEAMGEPPAGSVVHNGIRAYERRTDIWQGIGSDTRYPWREFEGALRMGVLTLLKLGDGRGI